MKVLLMLLLATFIANGQEQFESPSKKYKILRPAHLITTISAAAPASESDPAWSSFILYRGEEPAATILMEAGRHQFFWHEEEELLVIVVTLDRANFQISVVSLANYQVSSIASAPIAKTLFDEFKRLDIDSATAPIQIKSEILEKGVFVAKVWSRAGNKTLEVPIKIDLAAWNKSGNAKAGILPVEFGTVQPVQ